MKKQLMLILCLLTGLIGKNLVMGQEDLFKALFMYNFTKDIEWPSNFKQGSFKILVFGNSDIVGELEKLAQKKKVGNQPIEVVKANSLSDISASHVLYIASSKSSQLDEILSKIGDRPVLLITDDEGLAAKGACINYVTVDGKQKFEINPDNITNRGLKVNSYLLSLGIVVNK